MSITTATAARQLFVLGCSQTKRKTSLQLPAITRYDGPLFRVLRTFLRKHLWPENLSVAVLSAKHGLIGGLTGIEDYDDRLTPTRAGELRDQVTRELGELLQQHEGAELFMGRGYLEAIHLEALGERARRLRFVEGRIGQKLHQLSRRLSSLGAAARHPVTPMPHRSRPLYFLPDWDDFLDIDYDFETDRLSSPSRKGRNEAHAIELMRPKRLCDGVLVSLAQHLGTKGMLKRIPKAAPDSIAPRSVREHFGLARDQWAFCDCGAFSYANETEPTISLEQAVAVYDLYGFDLGASVDHIPLREIWQAGRKTQLSEGDRRKRVDLTRENADAFLRLAHRHEARFLPVGVIQGLDPGGFARQIHDYYDMGYRHLALGGLVPRGDAEVLEIVQCVSAELDKLPTRPWVHLMGIFRPKLQDAFRRSGIDSFDSATYFRKAWLRSDQNYLGMDGNWYAAIRVPPTHDARTWKRLQATGRSPETIRRLEADALAALRSFDHRNLSVDDCLKAIMSYDRLLTRAKDEEARLIAGYRNTLGNRPWSYCSCPFCRESGIEILVFRGANRNKRRGAHNTWQLFRSLRNRHIGIASSNL
jgi:hypothetical protein